MKFTLIAVVAALVLVAVAVVVLGSIDIPAPSGHVEKTIPTEKLIR